MENRKRRVPYTEKTGVLSGTPVQPWLSGDEEPLLYDTDWSHDSPDHRSMGDVVEESKTEQETKAPAPAQCVDKQ